MIRIDVWWIWNQQRDTDLSARPWWGLITYSCPQQITFLVTRIFINPRWCIFSLCTAVYKQCQILLFNSFSMSNAEHPFPFCRHSLCADMLMSIYLIEWKPFRSAYYLLSTTLGAENPRLFMIQATPSRVHLLLRKTFSFLFLTWETYQYFFLSAFCICIILSILCWCYSIFRVLGVLYCCPIYQLQGILYKGGWGG